MTENRHKPDQKNDDQISPVNAHEQGAGTPTPEAPNAYEKNPEELSQLKVWGKDRYSIQSIPSRDLGSGPTSRVVFITENFTDGSALEILTMYGVGLEPHPLEEMVLFANRGVKAHAKRQRKIARKMLEDFGGTQPTETDPYIKDWVVFSEKLKQLPLKSRAQTLLEEVTKPGSPPNQTEIRGLTALQFWGPIVAMIIMVAIALFVGMRIDA